MSGIGFRLTDGWRLALPGIFHVNRRIVRRDELDRRILLNPRHDFFAVGDQQVEFFRSLAIFSRETESVSSVNGIRNPFAEFLRIERGLCTGDGGAAQSGGFAGNRVTTLGIGDVSMQGEPERSACSG